MCLDTGKYSGFTAACGSRQRTLRVSKYFLCCVPAIRECKYGMLTAGAGSRAGGHCRGHVKALSSWSAALGDSWSW